MFMQLFFYRYKKLFMTQYSNILEYSKKRKNYEIIKIKQTIMKKQKYFMSKNKSRENK